MLPDWIDKDAWEGFLEMRKLKKRPMTERAKRMCWRKLEQFKERGHDPNQILATSEYLGWLDVYEPNDSGYIIRSREQNPEGKAHLSADDIAHYKKLGLLQ